MRIGYALGEGLLGFDTDPSSVPRRRRGRLAGVRRASDLVVLGDADTLDSAAAIGIWSPLLAPTGPATLADVLAGGGADSSRFDLTRHRRRANLAYADGHVEAVPITPAGLAGAHLVPPGP